MEYWFDGADIDRIHKQNESFNSASPKEEWLLSTYKKPKDHSNATCKALEALRRLHEGKLLTNSRSAVTKLGQALAKHGFDHIHNRGTKKWLMGQA